MEHWFTSPKIPSFIHLMQFFIFGRTLTVNTNKWHICCFTRLVPLLKMFVIIATVIFLLQIISSVSSKMRPGKGNNRWRIWSNNWIFFKYLIRIFRIATPSVEIRSYLVKFVKKFNLKEHIIFGTEVKSLIWNELESAWYDFSIGESVWYT